MFFGDFFVFFLGGKCVRYLVVFVVMLGAGWALGEEKKEENMNSPWGTWRQVAVVADGKEFAVGPSTRLTVTKEGYMVTVQGQIYQEGTTKVVGRGVDKSLVESDVQIAEGVFAGKTLKQISKIEGDVLIACIGVERPKEFKSKKGSGHTLSVWIRVP